MALRFSTTGVAVYGTSTVAVNGSTPAALVGRTVGPAAWKQNGVLVFQDGTAGWILRQLTLPSTFAAIDSLPASRIAGGGGEWAAQSASGLRTSIAVGPFAGSALGDVSGDGELLAISNGAALSGLTVYDASGAIIFQDDTIVLRSNQVCLRDSILSYYGSSATTQQSGWHLIDLTSYDAADGSYQLLKWFPRTDGVTWLVPVTHRGAVMVVEFANGQLSLRPATRANGWVISTDPTRQFSPDAVSISNAEIRIGVCTNGAETPASLVVFDCAVSNTKNISVDTGTVVAGNIVYGTPQSVTPQDFQVGAQEGSSLVAPDSQPPFIHPVEEKTPAGMRMSGPWQAYIRQLQGSVASTASVVQRTPPQPIISSGGYDKVASSGQPTMQTSQGATTLNIESTNGSVTVTLNPASNTVDLSAAGAWIPLVDGSEPPNFITDGAGHLILVAYP